MQCECSLSSRIMVGNGLGILDGVCHVWWGWERLWWWWCICRLAATPGDIDARDQEFSCDTIQVDGVLNQPISHVRQSDATTAKKKLKIAIEGFPYKELTHLPTGAACVSVVQWPPLPHQEKKLHGSLHVNSDRCTQKVHPGWKIIHSL